MDFDIVTFGSLIVEIIRKDLDRDLDVSAEFLGPYASGDTPIFINAAARLGAKTGLIGAVGEDDFGKCVVDKLNAAGVDLTYVTRHKRAYTGSTFVMYRSDGSRRFLYHLTGSGSGMVDPDAFTKEYLSGCKWVHYTGFTLESSESYRKAVYRSLEMLERDTKVSFDPNIRPELFTPDEIREMCLPIIKRADVMMPSGQEAILFTKAKTEEEACEMMTDGGRKLVVLKRGADGCRFFTEKGIIDIPPFKAEEVDPTGAGDTFDAALLVAFIEGKSIEEAGRFANAAGAFAVTRRGPMEGAPSRKTLDEFLASGRTEARL